MAVPKFHEYFNVFLKSLQDGNIHSFHECQEYVRSCFNLTENELSETTPSGQLRWKNRIYWCKTYLLNAGLICSPKRAHLQITNRGKEIVNENVVITIKLLEERFSQFAKWRGGKAKAEDNSVNNSNLNDETPQETFDRVYQEINDSLSDDLLTTVHSMSADFFEHLVVKLMEGMGYGGYEGAGFKTKSSGDGGIDGVIYEDKLGFNLIYIQAKRWALDRVIDRPEIQKFMGALAGPPKIEKGIFITTAKFSQGAQDYADAQHIILVDGKKLAELMIEFDIGVSTQKAYKLKRIDNDFFSEE